MTIDPRIERDIVAALKRGADRIHIAEVFQVARGTVDSVAKRNGLGNLGLRRQVDGYTIPANVRRLDGFTIPAPDPHRGRVRCPGCGGLVFMPCVKCAVDSTPKIPESEKVPMVEYDASTKKTSMVLPLSGQRVTFTDGGE